MRSNIGHTKTIFTFFFIGLIMISSFLSGCGVTPQNTTTTTAPTNTSSDSDLIVHFLDVGQGDSIFVQLPQGKNMLIDAGTNESGSKVVNYLKAHGVKKVDYLIGTHPHADHIGGLDQVIQQFDIGKIYLPKTTNNTASYRDVLLAIKEKGLKVTPAKAGLALIQENNLKAMMLAPLQNHYDDLNNYSAVIKLTYGQTSFLFTGDAEKLSEKEMLKSGVNLQADILKVGHHGSKSSTSAAFLKTVNPQMAIISVGKGNDYGHPHQVTLDRLNKYPVTVYRTDNNGTITVTSNGTKYTVDKEK